MALIQKDLYAGHRLQKLKKGIFCSPHKSTYAGEPQCCVAPIISFRKSDSWEQKVNDSIHLNYHDFTS